MAQSLCDDTFYNLVQQPEPIKQIVHLRGGDNATTKGRRMSPHLASIHRILKHDLGIDFAKLLKEREMQRNTVGEVKGVAEKETKKAVESQREEACKPVRQTATVQQKAHIAPFSSWEEKLLQDLKLRMAKVANIENEVKTETITVTEVVTEEVTQREEVETAAVSEALKVEIPHNEEKKTATTWEERLHRELQLRKEKAAMGKLCRASLERQK